MNWLLDIKKKYDLLKDQGNKAKRASMEKAPEWVAVAGDPAHYYDGLCRRLELPQSLLGGERKQFVIEGNSMSPRGINHGTNVIAIPIDNDWKVKEGQYVIVQVDDNYYHGESAQFLYKLRLTIHEFKAHETVKQMIEYLKNNGHDEIVLKINQDCLREKLSKTRGQYGDIDLVLSQTFKNGKLKYSFHKKDLVKYQIESVVRSTDVLTPIPVDRILAESIA